LLYAECVNILVEKRYAPSVVQAEYNKVLPGEEALHIVREIANKMHEEHLREVSRIEMETTIIPYILTTMPLTRAVSVSPLDILRNIEARSQLLVERGFNEKGHPIMAFSHLTFQEYLAALHLQQAIGRQGEPFTSSTLLRSYEQDPEWWEEVVLLYAAQLDPQQQISLFERIRPKRGRLQ
jgi:hypothetical protein